MSIESRVSKLESDVGVGQGEKWLHVARPLDDGRFKMRKLDGSEHILTFEQVREIGRIAPVIVIGERIFDAIGA